MMPRLSAIGVPHDVGDAGVTRVELPVDNALYAARQPETCIDMAARENSRLAILAAQQQAAAEIAPHGLSLVGWRAPQGSERRFVWNATRLTPPDYVILNPQTPMATWKRDDADSYYAPFYVPDVGDVVFLLDDGPRPVLQQVDLMLARIFAERRRTRDLSLQVMAKSLRPHRRETSP